MNEIQENTVNEEYLDLENTELENNLGFIFLPSLPYEREEYKSDIPRYDNTYNNYRVRVKQTLKIKEPADGSDKILNYIITVPANWKSNNAPYLRGLTPRI